MAKKSKRVGKGGKPKRRIRHLLKVYSGPCPQCGESLQCAAEGFSDHFQIKHGRLPREAEFYQFRTYAGKDHSPESYTTSFDSHPAEWSGGLPSLGRRH